MTRLLLPFFLLGLLCGLAACGQRIYPADPATRVHDSHAY
jgi:hypothetical protein